MLETLVAWPVRGPRAQCDQYHYAAEVQRILSTQPAIEVIAGTVDDLLVEDGRLREAVKRYLQHEAAQISYAWQALTLEGSPFKEEITMTRLSQSLSSTDGSTE